jgi:hypothetical protein
MSLSYSMYIRLKDLRVPPAIFACKKTSAQLKDARF